MDEDRKIGGRGELTGRRGRRLKQTSDDSRKARQVRRRGEDWIKDNSRKGAKGAKFGEEEKKG